MNQGICTNLPMSCDKARDRELIDMPTSDSRCPECNMPLKVVGKGGGVETGPRGGSKGSKLPFLIGAAVLAVLLAGGAGYLAMHMMQGKPPVVEPTPTPTPTAPISPKPSPSPTPPATITVATPAINLASAPCALDSRWKGNRQELCQIQDRSGQVMVKFDFAAGSADLDESAEPALAAIQKLHEENKASRLLVVGFGDDAGNFTAQCKLSEDRAESVRQAIAERGWQNVAARGLCHTVPGRSDEPVEVYLFDD
jgi:outer membrane protein OmpA-like peptidoglycan-associated protein